MRGPSFVAAGLGDVDADVLGEPKVKYRHAASRGKTFIGDDELLLRLKELGSEPVSGVDAHHAGKNFYVYVILSTLKPVGKVIMCEAQPGRAASSRS